ncbi:CLUMA_CG003430, isoform A [Clunio marinus]|uniref:CLUMA_CG003430, isoform A n=1 Tax=Clunio marinus TaxID=568069 RepID=A0A1J1HQW4_9DIPT|nr:CLUMA_CG003430, isoform A [Clunio marinus]
MDNPELFTKSNLLTKNESEKLVKIFCNMFADKLRDGSVLIDVGCGDGGTLVHVISLFAIKFKEVVGVDISDNMIKYARNTYGNEVMKFHQLDVIEIGSLSNDMLFQRTGIKYQSADIVTSFICLQWIEDLKKAFENMRKLIKPDGFLVVNLVKDCTSMSKSYEEVSQREKYRQFINGVKIPIFPLKNIDDPCKVLNEMLTEINFAVKMTKFDKVFIDHKNPSAYFDLVKSAYTLSPTMPEELQNEFYDDFFERIEPFVDQSDGGYIICYECLHLIAVKSN